MLHRLKTIFSFFVLGFLLTSCGFEPLLQQPDATTKETLAVKTSLSQIKIPAPLTRSQQLFTNAFLKETFTPKTSAPYLYNLRYELSESISGLGLLSDGTFSISEVTYTVPFSLSDSKTGKILFKDQVSVRLTYTVSNTNPYTTLVGKEGTDAKAFSLLAQALAIKLSVLLTNPPKTAQQSSLVP